MINRFIGTLVVTLVLAQGLQLLHGIGHVLPVTDGDCIVCLKVDKLKHALLVDAAPRVSPLMPAPGIAGAAPLSPRPATLLYGSGAFGGLVNVSTGRSAGMKVDGGSGTLALHLDGQLYDSEDYDAAGGRIRNSAVESEDLNFGLSIIGRRGYLGAAFGRYASRSSIPLDPGEPAEKVFIDQDQDRIDTGAELRRPLPWLRSAVVRLGYVDYQHTGV